MLNLAFGWIWITMGFLTGAALGMGFHKEQFMGGYNSWPRRLSRLGHIAFFGTGFLNVLVGLTGMAIGEAAKTGGMWYASSWAFVIGAVAMPICCFIAAKWMKAKAIFVIPVVALTAGGVMMSLLASSAWLKGVI